MMNLLGIPTNRIVAFFGPYLSIIAGIAAAWVVAKVNIIGLPGLDEDNVATWLTGGGTLALTAALSWLGHTKWLNGHQIELRGLYNERAAQAMQPPGEAVSPGDLDALRAEIGQDIVAAVKTAITSRDTRATKEPPVALDGFGGPPPPSRADRPTPEDAPLGEDLGDRQAAAADGDANAASAPKLEQ